MYRNRERRDDRAMEEGGRNRRSRPENRDSAAQPAVKLTEAEEKITKSLHWELEKLEHRLSFNDCKQLLLECDFNQDVAVNNVLDGKFKPWKNENTNAKYGGHYSSKQRALNFHFNDKEVISEGVANYKEQFEIMYTDEKPKQTETFVDYVETEEEKEQRLHREAEKQAKKDKKQQEKREKKEQEQAEKGEKVKEVVEAVYNVIEIADAEPVETITVKPAQPIIVNAQPEPEQTEKAAAIEPATQPESVIEISPEVEADSVEPKTVTPSEQANEPTEIPLPPQQMPQPAGGQFPPMPFFWNNPFMPGMMPPQMTPEMFEQMQQQMFLMQEEMQEMQEEAPQTRQPQEEVPEMHYMPPMPFYPPFMQPNMPPPQGFPPNMFPGMPEAQPPAPAAPHGK